MKLDGFHSPVSLAHLPPLEEKAENVSFYLNTAVHFIAFECKAQVISLAFPVLNKIGVLIWTHY